MSAAPLTQEEVMTNEIDALASVEGHAVIDVLNDATELLKRLQRERQTAAAVDDADADMHATLTKHFDSMAEVASLMALFDASAPPLDELAAQVAQLKTDDGDNER